MRWLKIFSIATRVTSGRVSTNTFRFLCLSKDLLSEKQLIKSGSYFKISGDKTEETFIEAIKMYTNRPGPRRGHVEFIYSALKYMEEFRVHQNLQVYKQIIDILPKGQYIATNMFQAEFMHYPKQQECIIDVLEKMEENGVIPDVETEKMLLNIFGRHAHPVKKLRRMLYWMPKFKNLSPWLLPDNLPNATIELAKLAILRMGSVDPSTELDIFLTKDLADSLDKTWIVSGQSPDQRNLLDKLEDKQTIYVEGAFTLWLKKQSINYFILRSEPKTHLSYPTKITDLDDTSELHSRLLDSCELNDSESLPNLQSIHEQEDGIILATAITGTCSRDSLLSWIRFLERKNPRLANLSVLFAAQSPLGDIIPASEQTDVS